MLKIVYQNPFIPAEWIAAHGAMPVRITPRSSSINYLNLPQNGVCPYARAFWESALAPAMAADAIIATTTCDQMRRASEIAAQHSNIPIFLSNVPSTWQTPVAFEIYIAELNRLGEFLISLIHPIHPTHSTGLTFPVSVLSAVMPEFQDKRVYLQSMHSRISPRRFAESLAMFQQTGELLLSVKDELDSDEKAVPLAILGGPLMADHLDLFDIISDAGGRIVLDATTTGERTLPAMFNTEVMSADPLRALATAYFSSIPDAFRRPDSHLHEWLECKIHERGVRGAIAFHYVWCDKWRAQIPLIRERIRLPLLSLDLADGDQLNDGRLAGRIQAFMEMMQ